jgi:Reverse transcriptase (RNA-dependent DNA polymerase)
LSKVHKRYPIHQSPLYKLVGIGQLERLIDVDLAHLDRLLSPENYRVWLNDRGREIQQPIKWLGRVHKRIGGLLSRIEVPDYVFSQKGRSYADNARHHVGNVPLGKTDISKFYPSTTRYMVWRMFVCDFQCAEDVAHILADVCCYEQKHLPTGSPLSGRLAQFAASAMFEKIHDLATENASRMSVYVDDVTLSGPTVTKRLIGEVRRIVHRHGLKTKHSKTTTYSATASKVVTGAVIVGDALKLPNARHKRIWETRVALRQATKPSERNTLLNSLRGRVQEAQQVLKK